MALHEEELPRLDQIKVWAGLARWKLDQLNSLNPMDDLDGFLEQASQVIVSEGDLDHWLNLGGYRTLLSIDGVGPGLREMTLEQLDHIMGLTELPPSTLRFVPLADEVTEDQLTDFELWFEQTMGVKYPTGDDYQLGDITLDIRVDEGYPSNLVGIYIDMGWGPVLLALIYPNSWGGSADWQSLELIKRIKQVALKQAGFPV